LSNCNESIFCAVSEGEKAENYSKAIFSSVGISDTVTHILTTGCTQAAQQALGVLVSISTPGM
jgi:hypothetical protein